jgi:N-acetylmuramoyl-L-alanine amidase
MALSDQVRQALEDRGFTSVLTRTADYRVTVASRVAIAMALGPKAFISVHHSGDPSGHSDRPGTETFYKQNRPTPDGWPDLSMKKSWLCFDSGRKPPGTPTSMRGSSIGSTSRATTSLVCFGLPQE